jgi:hypothetical protein
VPVDTSKHFVMKIRRSEQRRNRRMMHWSSDSSLVELYRHKCFRFRQENADYFNQQIRTVHESDDGINVLFTFNLLIRMLNHKKDWDRVEV